MKVKSLIKELYSSPIGIMEVISTNNGIISINFSSLSKANDFKLVSASDSNASDNDNHTYSEETSIQLDEYFAGKRWSFNLKLDLQGTDFQKKVWQAMLEIPHGQTLTYGEIARKIGKPGSARAVGMACNKNPLLVIVPCHRVVGANGALTGYAGGLLKKQWLLTHEKVI